MWTVWPPSLRHAQAKVFFGDDASSGLEGGDMDVSQTPVAAVRGPIVPGNRAFEDDSRGGPGSITVVRPDASAGSRDSSLRLGPGSGKPCSLQLPMGTLAAVEEGCAESGHKVLRSADGWLVCRFKGR